MFPQMRSLLRLRGPLRFCKDIRYPHFALQCVVHTISVTISAHPELLHIETFSRLVAQIEIQHFIDNSTACGVTYKLSVRSKVLIDV
jgi:hypothetical protein